MSSPSVREERLIEVWKVLEALVVSLDRIGSLEAISGEDSATALRAYFDPELYGRLTKARTDVRALLEEHDPRIGSRLERFTDNEDEIGYWRGERAS